MGRFRVSFNGIILPNNIRVKDVRHSILPPVSQNAITIPGRAGALPLGNTIDVRKIEMDIVILAPNEREMPKYASILANWLLYDEPKKLEIEDMVNLGRYYMAMYTGESSIEELSRAGNTTLTFLCYDPYAYTTEEEITFSPQEVIRLSNLGDTPIYPKIELKINKNLTNLTFVSSKGYVDIGKPLGVDDTTDEYEPYIVSDGMNSLAGWTQSSSIYGGYVDVPLSGWGVRDNQSFIIRDWTNEGTSWHGGCIQKQGLRSINDFQFIAPISFNGKSLRAKGAIQTNVLNENGGYLVTVQYKDDNSSANMCHINVRLHGGGSVYEVLSYAVPTSYVNFTGAVYVTRKSNRWYIEVKYKTGSGGVAWTSGDPGKLITIKTASYVDGAKKYISKAKSVQIACMMNGQYKDGDEDKNKNFLRNDMKFWNIYLKDITPYFQKDNVTPTIIYAGDTIIVDNETGEVYKNNELFMQFLDPTSPFIRLDKEENGLSIAPENCYSTGKITYTPKFK